MVSKFFDKHEETIRKTIISVLLIWIVSISLYLSANTAPTSDEFTFVTSGYSYWKTMDFRMNTEQPPLLKLIDTIPLLFMSDIKFPIEHASWKKAKLFENDGFYKEFIFHANNDKKEKMLFATRAMNSALSLILAIIILLWATELFGKWAGVLALAIYSFEPTILAYSSLFMMDSGFTLFATIAFYTLWKYIKNPTTKNLAFAAIAFGLTQLTKHTAILLYGIYPAIMIVYLIAGKVKTPKRFANKKIIFLATSYITIALMGLLFINATYGFKGTFQTAQQMFDNDNNIDKTIYTPQKLFENPYLKFISQNIPLPLPYYYVKGLGYVTAEAKAERTIYLFGEHSKNGFWSYYILSYLVKTPIPILIMLIAAAIWFAAAKKNIEDDLILIVPTLIYVFLFSINQKQIGLRHLLQIYPLLMIFISRIANSKISAKATAKTAIILMAVWLVFEAGIAFPDYISYQNEIIGIDNGYKYFADANVDFSQNVDKAISFIKNNPQTKVAIGTTDIINEYVNFTKLKNCEKGLVIADASSLNNNPQYNWLRCKMPTKRIGRTLFVYNITKC